MKQCIQLLSSVSLALSITSSAPASEPSLATVEQQFRELAMEAKRLTGTGQQTLTWGAPSPLDQELSRLAAGRQYTASPVAADPFEATCTLPADLDLTKSRVYLEADELTPEEAASITVNGTHAGGFIGKPFRLDVTKNLKTGPNTIRMEPSSPKSARLVAY